MQDSSVGWDPISINHHLPWQERLFVLYLVVVLGMSVISSLGMLRQLWFAGPLSKNKKLADATFLCEWEMCIAKSTGMKRMAVLTLLLTLVTLADGATQILMGIAQEKRVWSSAVAGGLAELGGLLTWGFLAGAVLYGLASLYQGVLARRRASWNYSRSSEPCQRERICKHCEPRNG